MTPQDPAQTLFEDLKALIRSETLKELASMNYSEVAALLRPEEDKEIARITSLSPAPMTKTIPRTTHVQLPVNEAKIGAWVALKIRDSSGKFRYDPVEIISREGKSCELRRLDGGKSYAKPKPLTHLYEWTEAEEAVVTGKSAGVERRRETGAAASTAPASVRRTAPRGTRRVG